MSVVATPEPLGERLRSLAADTQLIYLHTLLPDSMATGCRT